MAEPDDVDMLRRELERILREAGIQYERIQVICLDQYGNPAANPVAESRVIMKVHVSDMQYTEDLLDQYNHLEEFPPLVSMLKDPEDLLSASLRRE